VLAGDFAGNVCLWEAKTGQSLGRLEANPRPLDEQLAAAQKRVQELLARSNQPPAALQAAEHSFAATTALFKAARTAAENATNDFKAKAAIVAQLKEVAAKPTPPSDIEAQLTAARTLRETARAANTAAAAAVEAASQKLTSARSELEKAQKLDSSAELAAAQRAWQHLQASRETSLRYHTRESLTSLTAQREAVDGALKVLQQEIERLTKALAQSPDANAKTKLTADLTAAQNEAKVQRMELEKISQALQATQAKLEKLR
jgi:hypothetical protein